MFNQSLGSLPGVLNSLVQLGQVQISDIVPLENSAMEAVAVLLVVSSTAIDESPLQDVTLLEENEPKDPFAIETELTRVIDPFAKASNLERFLSDIDSDLEGVPRDLFGAAGDPSGTCPRGGLGQTDAPRGPSTVVTSGDRCRSTVNFDSEAAPATTPPDSPTTRAGLRARAGLGAAHFLFAARSRTRREPFSGGGGFLRRVLRLSRRSGLEGRPGATEAGTVSPDRAARCPPSSASTRRAESGHRGP